MKVVIQSFNGIGDLLFVTPTIRRIKEAYVDSHIVVNTNYPQLIVDNPYVDKVGSEREGIFLGYPDPIHCKEPIQHHILSDWEIVTGFYGITTAIPFLQPEICIDLPKRERGVGVQVLHKGHWHRKKVWPYFEELARGYEAIPKLRDVRELVRKIASYDLVVCSEGGISHIAKAVGTQAIVLFGGWSNPKWNGYQDQVNVTNKVACSYCYNTYLCVADYKCWKQIKLEYVRSLISEAAVCCSGII